MNKMLSVLLVLIVAVQSLIASADVHHVLQLQPLHSWNMIMMTSLPTWRVMRSRFISCSPTMIQRHRKTSLIRILHPKGIAVTRPVHFPRT